MMAGLILAGGRASRMGGADKALLSLAGKPLLAHVIERLRPQIQTLALSANGDPARFAGFGLPVLPDSQPDFPGPLAGILAGMDWARATSPDCRWLLTAPCDAPFLPLDLAARLWHAVQSQGADLALASSNGSQHPVIGLWPLSLADDLRQALTAEGLHKVGLFAGRYRQARAEFPLEGGYDPFMNINTPEELSRASGVLPPTNREGPAR